MSPTQTSHLNVLMINAQQTGGGAGRVGEMLADGLRSGDHTVSAFVRDNIAHDPTCHQVRHWRTARLARWLHRRGLPEFGHLTALLWRVRPEYAAADVLHLHNIHGEYVSVAALPLWCFDKPVVWTLHDQWPLTGNCAFPYRCTRWQQGCGQCPQVGNYPMADVDRSRFYRWLKPRLFELARLRLVTPSQWLADRVREVPQFRRLPLRVIPNPVATDIFAPTPQPDGPARRVRVGRTRPHRNYRGLRLGRCAQGRRGRSCSAAASRLRRAQHPGAGHRANDRTPARDRWSARSRPAVHSEPRCARAQAYACADVCLFPSHAENHPLTVLEAQACGTPVIAYAIGGVPEQIEHQKTGYLARDGHVDELAAGVVCLLRKSGRGPTHWPGGAGRGRAEVVRAHGDRPIRG